MTDVFAPKDQQTRELEVAGVKVRVSSYAIRDRFSARVENLDPGTVIGKGSGKTRDEAEAKAIAGATPGIEASAARAFFHRSTAELKGSEDSQ